MCRATVRPAWLLDHGLRKSLSEFRRAHAGELSFGQIRNATYDLPQRLNASETTSHEPILPRLAAGESRAMNECIDRFGGLVWSIVKRMIRNESEAEDLVQEIFTEIWKKAGFFDPEVASESTFIALVARRRAIDFLRRGGRRPGFEPLEAAESIPAASAPAAPLQCDPEAVKSSVASLPDETRRLFRMFFEDGFTHPEIAEKTGLPLGTVKTRLRRGLITLREQLRRASSTIQPAS
jgi:RNA polymerase sigma-70 factor, ECF subfamily